MLEIGERSTVSFPTLIIVIHTSLCKISMLVYTSPEPLQLKVALPAHGQRPEAPSAHMAAKLSAIHKSI